MDRINSVYIHEPWGFDKIFPYLKDAFRVLNEAYKKIYDEKSVTPYSPPTNKKKWDLENILTEDLVRITERIPTQLPYEWDIESRNLRKKNRIDITIIYALGLGFGYRLGIECKRVDSGNELCRNYYEKGIKRFVTGYYSEQMQIAGMLGFIQKDDVTQIVSNINRHLPALTTLRPLHSVSMAEQVYLTYLSRHKRDKNLGEIKIYHLMLDYINIIV